MICIETALLVHRCADRMPQLARTARSVREQRFVMEVEHRCVAYCDEHAEADTRRLLADHGFAIEPAPVNQFEKLRFALERQRGDYLAFCHTDDVWSPDKLRFQRLALEATGREVCISAYHSIGADGTAAMFVPALSRNLPRPTITYSIMSGWLLRRGLRLPDPLNFHHDFGIEQYACYVLSLAGCRFVLLATPTFVYTEHPAQTCETMGAAEMERQWAVLRESLGAAAENTIDAVSVFVHPQTGALFRLV